MKKIFYVLILSIVIFASCTKENNNIDTDKKIVEQNVEQIEEEKKIDIAINSENVEQVENYDFNYGTSHGNFQNGGYVNYYDGYTYYAKEDGIYTLSSDGDSTKVIDINKPNNINIINNELFFCSEYIDLKNVPAWAYTIIYKAKLDGTEIQEIIRGNYIFDVMIYNGRIYYIEDLAPTFWLPKYELYSTDLKGNDKQNIISYSTEEVNKHVKQYYIIDNCVYFLEGEYLSDISNTGDFKYSLKKMELDSRKTDIIVEDVNDTIIVYSNYIYFRDREATTSTLQYVYDPIYNEVAIVNESRYLFNNKSLNYLDDEIYYIKDGKVYLNKGYDGMEIKFSTFSINNVLITDEWIFGYSNYNCEFRKISDIFIVQEPSTLETSDFNNNSIDDLSEDTLTWQEEYATILMEFVEGDHNLYFQLYDFDLDYFPELIIVGMSEGEEYDVVYTYKDYEVKKLEYGQDVFSAAEFLAARGGLIAPLDFGQGLAIYHIGPSAGNFGTNLYYKLIKIDGNNLVIGATGDKIIDIEVLNTLFDDFGRDEKDQDKLNLAIQENTYYYINDIEVSKEEFSQMFVVSKEELQLFEITEDNIENKLSVSLE